MTADVENANRLYREFREATPRGQYVRYPRVPKALARLGTCEFVGYQTTHQGRLALYVHYFAAGSRPGLYANTGRGQLYLVGGRFRVTYRGITDLDSRGREIDYKPKYRTLTEEEYQKLLRAARRVPGNYRVLNKRLTRTRRRS